MPKPRRKRINPFQGTPYRATNQDHITTIILFATHADLLAAVTEGPPDEGLSPACTLTQPDRCELWFCREYLREDFIAHEATHAALSVMKANSGRNQLVIGHDEEQLAYLVGSITRQICQWFETLFRD